MHNDRVYGGQDVCTSIKCAAAARITTGYTTSKIKSAAKERESEEVEREEKRERERERERRERERG